MPSRSDFMVGTVRHRCVAIVLLLASSAIAQETSQSELSLAMMSAEQAVTRNDAAGAGKAATEILAICLSDDLPSDDKQRIAALLLAAKVDFALGQFDRAFSTCEVLKQDAPSGSQEQLHARAFLLKRQMDANQPSLEDAIKLLGESTKLEGGDRTVRDECQEITLDAIAKHLSTFGNSDELIATEVSRIEQRLLDEGVPVGIARLSRLAYCQVLSDGLVSADLGVLLSEWEQTLDDLANVIQDPQVTLQRRALYWNLLTRLHLKRGHYVQALDACREFAKAAIIAKNNDARAIALDMSAMVALRLGDYSDAKNSLAPTGPYYRDQLAAANPSMKPRYLQRRIEWLVNYSKALEGSNHFAEANGYLREASELISKHREAVPTLAALVDNNLGVNHYLQGEFQQAAELMRQSREAMGRLDSNVTGSARTSEQAGEAAVNAGWIALGQPDAEQAAQYFAEASRFFANQLGTDHPRYAEALTYQARVAAIQHKKNQARAWIEQAENLVFERICRDLASTESSRDRLAMIQEARVHPESIAWPGTVDTYLELAEDLEIPDEKQYEVVLRWKGLLQRFESSQPESEHDDLEDELNAKLRRAYFKKVSFRQRRALEAEITGYELQLRELKRRRQRNRQIDPNDLRVEAAKVAATLNKNDLLVDIYQFRKFRTPQAGAALIGSDQEYVGFLIHPDGQIVRASLGKSSDVDAKIQKLTNTIMEAQFSLSESQHSNRIEQLTRGANDLAKSVLFPIVQSGENFTRLLICPDARANLIPWAALPGIRGKAYLVEELRLEIVENAIREESLPTSRDPASLLVVGGVEFKNDPELQGSVVEKENVRKAFQATHANGHVVELGAGAEAATEEAVMNAIVGTQWIHLATHGFFQRRGEFDVFEVTGTTALLQTGLVFTPPAEEDREHDEFLTAAEIRELDLSGAELVMLSACESGLGKSIAGLGVQGLVSSFHDAGASHVIGTLWKVNDEATTHLTKRFYHHLWEQGHSPADALRHAQLDMIHDHGKDSASRLRRDPYAWAAFICSAR